jgi:hypothetical protein
LFEIFKFEGQDWKATLTITSTPATARACRRLRELTGGDFSASDGCDEDSRGEEWDVEGSRRAAMLTAERLDTSRPGGAGMAAQRLAPEDRAIADVMTPKTMELRGLQDN